MAQGQPDSHLKTNIILLELQKAFDVARISIIVWACLRVFRFLMYILGSRKKVFFSVARPLPPPPPLLVAGPLKK